MAEPFKRSPGLDTFLQKLNPSGRNVTESVKSDICSSCGKSAVEFKDVISRKEYSISGLCQKCQDDFFNSEEE